MKKEELKKLSISDLKTKETSLKTITSILAGVLLFLFGLTIYNTIEKKKFDPLMVVAISSSVILIMNYKQIKDIRTEIKSRE